VEITDAEVRWNEEYTNKPDLIVYVDDTPSLDELQFEGSREEGLWYAEHEPSGYVNFFSWSGGEGDGYSGRHFDIETVDGEQVTLKGPFSSRSGALNKHGYGPCLEVSYKVPEFDHTYRAGAMTVEKAEEVVDEHLDDVELHREIRFEDEPYYVLRRTGGANQ